MEDRRSYARTGGKFTPEKLLYILFILANLILLCSRHHTLVHTGFKLTLNPVTRALQVTTSQGEPIPHRPTLPWRPAAELDPTARIDARTLPNTTYDKLELHHAVEVLLMNAA